ncbi:MAG: DNA methyltransferase [Verrucomicrobiota bacterium]
MLSWNEIRHRAIAFSRDWKGTTSEKSERQTFWNEFFEVFGIKRRAVSSFEEPVKKLSGSWGYIDLFWPGRVLVEHKSAGQDLDKAHAQGMDYVRGLIDSGRAKEAPRWLIVSDFKRIALHDLEPELAPDLSVFKSLPSSIEFPLQDLHKHIRRFAFIPGYKQHKLDPEDPANIEAAELMARLHDALRAGGFSGHDLRVLLVRVLFCLFADDTGIFNQQDFKLFLENRTAADGSDTGPKLARLFDVLNTPEDQRQANLDEDLAAFPYVNGALFAERIAFADFNAGMRQQLLEACCFEWARISPAVFGSLFQGVMVPTERRQIGAHYTSEKDILKLTRPLFLDALRAEFAAAKADKSTRRTARLEALQIKLGTLCFLDPACGCGNFLVITYRELRALELDILLELHTGQQQFSADDVYSLSLIDVDQMHGIEIEEFPTRIAEVALWLADHQANIALSEAFGQLFRRIPLKKSPHIVCANALRIDWKSILPPGQCSYVLGNPPFVGSKLLTPEQKADVQGVFGGKLAGVIDFVGGWYRLAVNYCLGNPTIRCAFVSTNSITQGEQVAALWPGLFAAGLRIHFAHRTFQWESEARGKAHVHCVIIGFGLEDVPEKILFDYPTVKADPQPVKVSRINCYLIEGNDVAIPPRTDPLSAPCNMVNGSIPADGGNLILSADERDELSRLHPEAAQFVREYLGAEGLINGHSRYCLWLAKCGPDVLRKIPLIMKRVQAVKEFRLASTKAATRAKSATASLFTEDRQPERGRYLAFPRTSSENRRYIPIAYLPAEIIAANDIQMVPAADTYQFGILTSAMHMAWTGTVTGRLKSDFRYSSKVVYNNFPWPEAATDTQRVKVEEAAQAVLDARQQFPGATLADLYDPISMPPKLAKAHEQLDRAVEKCYRPEPFQSDRQRVEYLFALYEQLTAPLAAEKKKPGKRKL